MSIHRQKGITLAHQQSASVFLHGILRSAVAAFPETFNPVELPEDSSTFQKNYPDLMPLFEAARLASVDRFKIARHLARATSAGLVFQHDNETQPLDELLQEPVTPLPLEKSAAANHAGWMPIFCYQDTDWSAEALPALSENLIKRGVISSAAGNALKWIHENKLSEGTLDLSGRKIVMVGAGAEMAPTQFWLQAGAEVLWLDVAPPPLAWQQANPFGGNLWWPKQNIDLLSRPQEVLATIEAFADGSPVDLGLYAYAPGKLRELRLTGAMNAIVNALPAAILGTVSILISPTTPMSMNTNQIADMNKRRGEAAWWETGLAGIGLLGKGGGHSRIADHGTTRTVVSIQGASYQAAQYLGKVQTAESWATYGQLTSPSIPLRVSANTAAITSTRSLDHPVFAAAFGGAAAFGIETFTPDLSQTINGLLNVYDWEHPNAPLPGEIRVHGGLQTLPYPLESALLIAALFGFIRSPRLLLGLLR